MRMVGDDRIADGTGIDDRLYPDHFVFQQSVDAVADHTVRDAPQVLRYLSGRHAGVCLQKLDDAKVQVIERDQTACLLDG